MRRSILAALLIAGSAAAHFAPSPDVNNRVIKITVLPDGVRLVYTVFFGDRPGVAERRRMDGDGNGAVDREEATRFGEKLRQEVAASVHVLVDGAAATQWTVADVGLGSPSIGAGSFSVDLVLRAPLEQSETHTLRFEDQLPLPFPGETHLRAAESPGVRLVSTGNGVQTAFDYAPGDSRVAEITFTVDPEQRRAPARSWLPVGAGAVLGLVAVGLALLWVRRYRKV